MNRELRTLALACVLVGALITSTNATGYVFTAPSGNWNVPGNWDPNLVPSAAGDTAHVGQNNSGCTCTVSAVQSGGDVYVGHSSTGTLDIQATGDLELNGSYPCIVGWTAASAGNGTVLVAGKLAAPTIYMGYGTQLGAEEGRIVQSSGIVTSSANLFMGRAVGTRTFFDQNGGTNYFATLTIGSQVGTYAVYTITNGSMTAPSLRMGDVSANSTGTLTVAGSAIVTSPSFQIGCGPGQNEVVNINGGTLNAPQIFLGFSATAGSACVTQTVGTVTCPALYMGWNAGGNPRYAMSGGVFDGGTVWVGYAGGGVATPASIDLSGGMMNLAVLYMGWGGAGSINSVNQSGGTNRITSGLQIGVNPGSSNAYTVSGGLLDVGSLIVGGEWNSANTATLTHAGGDIHASAFIVEGAPTVATLRLVLPQAGLSPIAVTSGVILNGTLELARASDYRFAPRTVITAMTYSATSGRAGSFTQTNLLGGMTCRVNYDVDLGGGLKAITLDQLQPAMTYGTIVSFR